MCMADDKGGEASYPPFTEGVALRKRRKAEEE